ncbi:MAG: alpha-N-acetylglucosaminidase [Alistipes sp.]|nr:alpha-N-acetylglucosaminidase [Alistipes sp.]
MKRLLLLLLSLCFGISAYASDTDAMRALIKRLLPAHAEQFVVEKLPAKGDDYFRLRSQGDRIVIGGNNANSMAVGLNHYLRYWCNTSVSWFAADPVQVPEVLPRIDTPTTISARCKNRFFLNYCTFGYTMPWWKWSDWERFIDWMALQGINLPLAITGQESIWYRVWTSMGLTDEQVRAYFTGPAHLPWHRMLNIDYWHGGVPKSWLESQEALQKQIVARERELNMRPVLPAFAGHVPKEIKQIYPDAPLSTLGKWGGFSEEHVPSFLDPMSPLFAQIQKAFLKEQTRLFGTDHIYGIDLFNEMDPPSMEAEYLHRVSGQVYETLRQVDKRAVWLQMTWLFYHDKQWTNERIEPYLTGVEAKNQLLLDYYCDKTEVWRTTDKFYGVPYIWCYLGNFGGNTTLIGNLHEVGQKIEKTFTEGGDNFAGLGSTLEGFDCNPFMYEFVFEKAWNMPLHNDVAQWSARLADRRAGIEDEMARSGWQQLIDKVYCSYSRSWQCSITNIRPSLGTPKRRYHKTKIYYDNKDLCLATGDLLKSRATTTTHAYDLVNMMRQILGNHFGTLLEHYKGQVAAADLEGSRTTAKAMMGIIADMERLLSSRTDFLVGKWIADARNFGINEQERTYYEQNARNILTTWGDRGIKLNDYATRSWAGMMESYYGVRWQMFFDAIDDTLAAGEAFDDVQKQALENRMTAFEKSWWYDCRGSFSSEPKGDCIAIARELYEKYHDAVMSVQ